MSEIRVPFSITYQTTGTTPVSDLIAALKATDDLAKDAVSLLPSLIEGLQVTSSSLNVRMLSQESPLKELFLVAIFLSMQDDLKQEIPSVLEELFNVTVSDKYDTLVTVAFLMVVFYGAGLAIDAARKVTTSSLARQRFNELVAIVSVETGKTPREILSILDAKFEKPSAFRRLLLQSKKVFLPSQRDQNAPMVVDSALIESDLIREVPYVGEAEGKSDFDRFTPYNAVHLELHAMDRDRAATGWAAVAMTVSPKRLKVRVMEPVLPAELWGKENVVADIVVVSKLTSEGYVPAEVQITAIVSSTEEDQSQ